MPVPVPGGEPDSWIALSLIPGAGPESIRTLLKHFGSPRNILSQQASDLSQIVGKRVSAAICAGADPEKLQNALRWLERDNHHLLTFADSDYPQLLLQIADPPPLLYLKGRRELVGRAALGVVGSRNATPSGIANAEAFSRAISYSGVAIISGMAVGIDTAAHRGGLDGPGSSIAVIGTGADLIYPARNSALASELAERGLIISEFPLGTPALAKNFPRRNRLISGLSKGILVVEAALASGSLITARQAAEQGREVFAIPGTIHSPVAKGCHLLIKQGAKLVDDVQDILAELQWARVSEVGASEDNNADTDAVDNSDPVLSSMGYDPVSADALLERIDLPAEEILARLAELEICGAIASLPGGKFQRLT